MSRLHKPKAGFWIRLCVAILYPLDGLLFRIRFRHLDRVPGPDQGGVIIALNHLSYVDTILMARAVWQSGRVPRFMIKAGAFGWPVIGSIFRGAGQIPVYRGTERRVQVLARSRHGAGARRGHRHLPRGHDDQGPGQLADAGQDRYRAADPAVPGHPGRADGSVGRAEANGGFSVKRLGRRRTAQLSVGHPLDLSKYRDAEPTQETLREITDVVMSAVRDQVAELRGEPAPAEFFVPKRKYVDKR